jgi:hypothetical protein
MTRKRDRRDYKEDADKPPVLYDIFIPFLLLSSPHHQPTNQHHQPTNPTHACPRFGSVRLDSTRVLQLRLGGVCIITLVLA